VAFDGTQEAEYSQPPLTVIRQPIQAIAANAISILTETRTEDPPQHAVHDYELIVRRSCGCNG
jgi:LacI family transcriptional regulator